MVINSPNFPTGSPYVTSVGGTRNSNPEVAWSDSGGGFSDYWPTQPWQTTAVSQYFTTAAGVYQIVINIIKREEDIQILVHNLLILQLFIMV